MSRELDMKNLGAIAINTGLNVLVIMVSVAAASESDTIFTVLGVKP